MDDHIHHFHLNKTMEEDVNMEPTLIDLDFDVVGIGDVVEGAVDALADVVEAEMVVPIDLSFLLTYLGVPQPAVDSLDSAKSPHIVADQCLTGVVVEGHHFFQSLNYS